MAAIKIQWLYRYVEHHCSTQTRANHLTLLQDRVESLDMTLSLPFFGLKSITKLIMSQHFIPSIFWVVTPAGSPIKPASLPSHCSAQFYGSSGFMGNVWQCLSMGSNSGAEFSGGYWVRVQEAPTGLSFPLTIYSCGDVICRVLGV